VKKLSAQEKYRRVYREVEARSIGMIKLVYLEAFCEAEFYACGGDWNGLLAKLAARAGLTKKQAALIKSAAADDAKRFTK
jgi:hypothetical protein